MHKIQIPQLRQKSIIICEITVLTVLLSKQIITTNHLRTIYKFLYTLFYNLFIELLMAYNLVDLDKPKAYTLKNTIRRTQTAVMFNVDVQREVEGGGLEEKSVIGVSNKPL